MLTRFEMSTCLISSYGIYLSRSKYKIKHFIRTSYFYTRVGFTRGRTRAPTITQLWNKKGVQQTLVLRAHCRLATPGAVSWKPIHLSTPERKHDDVFELGCLLLRVISSGMSVFYWGFVGRIGLSIEYTRWMGVRDKVKFLPFLIFQSSSSSRVSLELLVSETEFSWIK